MINKAKNNIILTGGGIVFKDNRGKRYFLVVKQGEGDWEFPKVTVRRGESSVRAVLRMTGELAGMNAKVLEEAGRASGVATINGKVLTQKYYYYLMIQKAGGLDIIGFDEFKWLEYGKAMKAIKLKREQEMLRQAKDVLREWEKVHNKKKK